MTASAPTSSELPAWKRIFRNASSLLVGGGVGEILTTYAVGLSALALGPGGFGTLAEAQAFMDPFEALAGFGLVQVSITLAARNGACDGTVRATVMGIRFGFACAAILAALSIAAATGRSALTPLLLLLAINSLASPITHASTLPFQCDQSMHRLVGVPFLAGVVRIATAYLAYWLICTPAGFQISATMAAAATAGFSFLFARRYYRAELRFDTALARQLLAIAWPIATLEVIVMVYCRGSYYLLHSAGPVVQGEFAAADRLVKPILTLAGAIVVSSLPTVAGMAGRSEFAELLRAYKRACLRICLSLAPITAAACLLMPYLLRRFAPEYANASSSFRILTIGAVFMFLNQLSSAFIISLGKFRLILAIGFTNLLVYFAIATYLVPRYAAPGAAVSTAITEAGNTIMQCLAVLYLLKQAIRDSKTDRRATSAT
jgi:O-antigen/teichoic acid export membrane protein